jgi:hypothetical protein
MSDMMNSSMGVGRQPAMDDMSSQMSSASSTIQPSGSNMNSIQVPSSSQPLAVGVIGSTTSALTDNSAKPLEAVIRCFQQKNGLIF